MREKVNVILIDEEPTFVMLDGTIIDTKQVGWICRSYMSPEDAFLERITKSDIDFIMDNDIECEIELESLVSDENDGFFDAERKPRLKSGKVIIHLK